MENAENETYRSVIVEIADLCWTDLNEPDLAAVALAYYYFSIQFRENLLVAVALYPEDALLQKLMAGECATDNLSPWPGIAELCEVMNHDEFMRRAVAISRIAPERRLAVDHEGVNYLARVRAMPAEVRACSIASYENGGLESTFRAMLTAPSWEAPGLRAFKHFLEAHIHFDSDPDEGHGALARHLKVDDRILPLWTDFRDLLITAAPALIRQVAQAA